MKTKGTENDLEVRAIAALHALLGQVSVIKLKEITRESQAPGNEFILVAQLDVLGRSHTLACEVRPSVQPESLFSSLHTVRGSETETRVIVAPYLSPEAQDLCKLNRTGFLDLEGNARIALGEVFIGRRCLAHPAALPDPQDSAQSKDLLKPIPPRSAGHTDGTVAAACQA